MSEYIGGQPLVIDEGEEIPIFCNESPQPISVGTGLIFHEDGEYLVSVHGKKIIVRPMDDGRTEQS
jgi:hypothetical protein